MALRDSAQSGEPVLGMFVKTTSPQIIELLACTTLDFIVLDAEHAPFGRESLSQCLAIAHLARLPALVRIPDHGAALINACLDDGAAGILVPHVRSPADVDRIADAARYSHGRRGFSPSTRAGGYGTVASAPLRAAIDAGTSIWCQIEDAEALTSLDAIAARDAVDCLFIGPADLSLSLGIEGPEDVRLEPVINDIIESGARHRRAIGLFVSRPEQIEPAVARGISVIVCGSDQSVLLNGVRALEAEMARTRRTAEGS